MIKPEFSSTPVLLAFTRALATARTRNVTADELRTKIQPYVDKSGNFNIDTLRLIVTYGVDRLPADDVLELINLIDPEGKDVVHVDDLVKRLITVNS